MDRPDLLWRQYSLHVDLYKFYLDLTIKITAFYYAVTGAIIAYVFQNSANGLAVYGLLLPIAFSVAVGALFFYGASLLSVIRTELFSIRDQLELETAPEVMVLIVFLRSFGTILVMTGLALAGFLLSRA